MTIPLLKVENLHAGYGRAEVLHGLNLEAKKGSVVTVIGPNGAGKSTLLNALMGVLPSKGQIHYNGHPIEQQELEDRVMQGIALVPETRALFGSMPVEDNLLLGAYRQFRLGKRDSQQAMEEVFTLFPRLKERRKQLAGTLSGGERSLGLAPLIVKEIFRTITGLRATGVTILLVEQNARAALEVADHGYVLEMGEIALEGPAAELAKDPRVIDTYLGAARKKQEA
jgi:branched-chain amino acid transport system ATP-binding protein